MPRIVVDGKFALKLFIYLKNIAIHHVVKLLLNADNVYVSFNDCMKDLDTRIKFVPWITDINHNIHSFFYLDIYLSLF